MASAGPVSPRAGATPAPPIRCASRGPDPRIAPGAPALRRPRANFFATERTSPRCPRRPAAGRRRRGRSAPGGPTSATAPPERHGSAMSSLSTRQDETAGGLNILPRSAKPPGYSCLAMERSPPGRATPENSVPPPSMRPQIAPPPSPGGGARIPKAGHRQRRGVRHESLPLPPPPRRRRLCRPDR